jgi:hypothetical protein
MNEKRNEMRCWVSKPLCSLTGNLDYKTHSRWTLRGSPECWRMGSSLLSLADPLNAAPADLDGPAPLPLHSTLPHQRLFLQVPPTLLEDSDKSRKEQARRVRDPQNIHHNQSQVKPQLPSPLGRICPHCFPKTQPGSLPISSGGELLQKNFLCLSALLPTSHISK